MRYIRVYLCLYICKGLPFHTHGEAWLGLVSGAKLWFFYPPSYTLPEELQRTWDPYYPIENFIQSLLSICFPSVFSSENLSWDGLERRWDVANGISIALQRPGEIIYIPDGWAHMTYNIPYYNPSLANGSFEVEDETNGAPSPGGITGQIPDLLASSIVIGIGSQSVWLAPDRWDTCAPYIDPVHTSTHYDCLKSAVISLLDKYSNNNKESGGIIGMGTSLLDQACIYAKYVQ